MSTIGTLTVTVKFKWAWWMIPYLSAVARLSKLTGKEPDIDKIVANAMRGYRLIVE